MLTGYTGDSSSYIMEGKEDVSENRGNNNTDNTCINCPKPSDSRIKHDHPFYYCIEHLDFKNIHMETIEHHLEFSRDHQKENE